jgi:hypothetical protein
LVREPLIHHSAQSQPYLITWKSDLQAQVPSSSGRIPSTCLKGLQSKNITPISRVKSMIVCRVQFQDRGNNLYLIQSMGRWSSDAYLLYIRAAGISVSGISAAGMSSLCYYILYTLDYTRSA